MHQGELGRHGSVTFDLQDNGSRKKLVGISDCGFRGFAYLRTDTLNLTNAKTSILEDFAEYKKKKEEKK